MEDLLMYWSLKLLNTNFTKWSNTFKQFVGNLPTNCLNVFDHFVKLVLKGLIVYTVISSKITCIVKVKFWRVARWVKMLQRNRKRGYVIQPRYKRPGEFWIKNKLEKHWLASAEWGCQINNGESWLWSHQVVVKKNTCKPIYLI